MKYTTKEIRKKIDNLNIAFNDFVNNYSEIIESAKSCSSIHVIQDILSYHEHADSIVRDAFRINIEDCNILTCRLNYLTALDSMDANTKQLFSDLAKTL